MTVTKTTLSTRRGDGPQSGASSLWQVDTEIPDGRIIEIGGEHEDSYTRTSAFTCVFGASRQGRFDILGYDAVFPPTDFHSATLVGNKSTSSAAWLSRSAALAATHRLYRLDCEALAIEAVKTNGRQARMD
jgi:hypothetical protein